MTATIERPAARTMGVAVLLVYGMLIPVPRDGQPGFRLTVQPDGAVHAEPVGFDPRLQAAALHLLIQECRAIHLDVDWLDTTPGIVVRRKEAPCPSS